MFSFLIACLGSIEDQPVASRRIKGRRGAEPGRPRGTASFYSQRVGRRGNNGAEIGIIALGQIDREAALLAILEQDDLHTRVIRGDIVLSAVKDKTSILARPILNDKRVLARLNVENISLRFKIAWIR